jgi:hypothetical protein
MARTPAINRFASAVSDAWADCRYASRRFVELSTTADLRPGTARRSGRRHAG